MHKCSLSRQKKRQERKRPCSQARVPCDCKSVADRVLKVLSGAEVYSSPAAGSVSSQGSGSAASAEDRATTRLLLPCFLKGWTCASPRSTAINCEANTSSLLVNGQQVRQRPGHSQTQSGTWQGQRVMGQLQRGSSLAQNLSAYFTGQSRCRKASSRSADANETQNSKETRRKEQIK